ncbi:MAG: Na+/H+ antiporter NhaC family protein, partial [Myxococcota bacterium]
AKPLSQVDDSEMQPPEGAPLRWYNAVVPIMIVLGCGFVGLMWSGGFFTQGRSLLDALANANSTRVFLWSSLIGSAVAIILATLQRILSFRQAVWAWVVGAKSIMFAIGILIFAWSISALSKDLGTAHYLIALLKSQIKASWVPLLIFLLSSLVAFATGTSFGTMGILLPIAAPLAYSMGGMPTLVLSVGAVLDGSIFGDHCSPLSDTTLFSSTSSACDHVDHVKTQIPYAVTVMTGAASFGYLGVGYGLPLYLTWILCFAQFVAIFLLLGKPLPYYNPQSKGA